MQIEIRVFATLRRYVPEIGLIEPLRMDVEPGTTFDQIREQLGLPAEEVKIFMRNNLQASLTEEAQDGDRIAYIPAIAGG